MKSATRIASPALSAPKTSTASQRSMSMDDLSRARDTITRCCATLLDASYTDGIPTETTDVWRTIAADARRDLDALTRWRDSLPVAKVARWDAARGAYVAHDNEGDVCMVATERERAIAWGYTIEGGPAEDSPERLPARCGDCKHYDGDRLCKASTGQRFTWGSYEPASWCPLRFAAKADDTAPERLRERREALGLSHVDAANLPGLELYTARDIAHWEVHSGVPGADRYAAALSAAEAERAAKPLTMNQMADALVGSLVAAGECDPEPAPEVVDVPQPLVIRKRLAGSEHSAAWSSDEPDVVTLYIGGAGEDAPLALLRAMLAAIDAQDRMVAIKGHHARWDAQLAPTRPEPRYKVGDWVRDGDGTARLVVEAPQWSRIQGQWRYLMASWSYSESELTPAIDPACPGHAHFGG